MAYATKKKELGKIPVTMVDVLLDKCSRTYGIAPCTASGAAGAECFNTRKTCQDPHNYSSNISAGLSFVRANNDVVDLGNVAFAASFTIVMRFKLNTVDILHGLSKRSNANHVNVTSSNKIQFFPPSETTGFTCSTALVAGTEYHLIITCANGAQVAYLDNVSDGTGAIATFANSPPVALGNNGTPASSVAMDGEIYEYILYNKIITSGERATLFAGGEVTDSRHIHHKFDTGAGLTATDLEGNNHGTLTGPEWINITKKTLTHSFKDQDNNNHEIEAIPALVSVSSAPTKIVIGKGLGYRAKATITLKDFTHHGRGVDPYVSTRTYDHESQGTYLGKLKACNPYYQGRKLLIKTGFESDPIDLVNDFITRQYIIESMSGPDQSGNFTIIAKDPLKLADNERSQCPALSTGSLSTAYTAGGTTLVLNSGDGADYSATGEVRIGDNILAYTGITTDTLTGVTGGEWGSTDANAVIGDKVQQCRSWTNINVVDIIYDLLINFAGIDAAFINTTDWDLERDTYLSTTTLTAIISEPEGVNKLIEELTDQFLLDVWWSDDEQLIKLQSIIPKQINTTEAEYTDESHIIDKGVKVSENVKDRLTAVWFYYAPIDYSKSADSDNSQKVKITIDGDAESSDQYGDKRIKKIFSRWTDSESLAIQTGGRLLNRDSSNRTQIQFSMDLKDSDLKTGNHFIINTKYITDEHGANLQQRMQVLSHDEVGGLIKYDSVQVNFNGRYAFVAANTQADYLSATDNERATVGFVGQNSGDFSDGGKTYKVI